MTNKNQLVLRFLKVRTAEGKFMIEFTNNINKDHAPSFLCHIPIDGLPEAGSTEYKKLQETATFNISLIFTRVSDEDGFDNAISYKCIFSDQYMSEGVLTPVDSLLKRVVMPMSPAECIFVIDSVPEKLI